MGRHNPGVIEQTLLRRLRSRTTLCHDVTLKGGQTAHGSETIVCHQSVELCLVDLQTRAVEWRMPKMEHAGRKTTVLPPNASVKQTHDQVGIFKAPTLIADVETVDPL